MTIDQDLYEARRAALRVLSTVKWKLSRPVWAHVVWAMGEEATWYLGYIDDPDDTLEVPDPNTFARMMEQAVKKRGLLTLPKMMSGSIPRFWWERIPGMGDHLFPLNRESYPRGNSPMARAGVLCDFYRWLERAVFGDNAGESATPTPRLQMGEGVTAENPGISDDVWEAVRRAYGVAAHLGRRLLRVRSASLTGADNIVVVRLQPHGGSIENSPWDKFEEDVFGSMVEAMQFQMESPLESIEVFVKDAAEAPIKRLGAKRRLVHSEGSEYMVDRIMLVRPSPPEGPPPRLEVGPGITVENPKTGDVRDIWEDVRDAWNVAMTTIRDVEDASVAVILKDAAGREASWNAGKGAPFDMDAISYLLSKSRPWGITDSALGPVRSVSVVIKDVMSTSGGLMLPARGETLTVGTFYASDYRPRTPEASSRLPTPPGITVENPRRRLKKLKWGAMGYCKRCQLMGMLYDGVCGGCLSGENPAPPWEPTSLVARSPDGRTKIVYLHAHKVYEVYSDGRLVGKEENRIAAYFMAGIPLPSEGW